MIIIIIGTKEQTNLVRPDHGNNEGVLHLVGKIFYFWTDRFVKSTVLGNFQSIYLISQHALLPVDYSYVIFERADTVPILVLWEIAPLGKLRKKLKTRDEESYWTFGNRIGRSPAVAAKEHCHRLIHFLSNWTSSSSSSSSSALFSFEIILRTNQPSGQLFSCLGSPENCRSVSRGKKC